MNKPYSIIYVSDVNGDVRTYGAAATRTEAEYLASQAKAAGFKDVDIDYDPSLVEQRTRFGDGPVPFGTGWVPDLQRRRSEVK